MSLESIYIEVNKKKIGDQEYTKLSVARSYDKDALRIVGSEDKDSWGKTKGEALEILRYRLVEEILQTVRVMDAIDTGTIEFKEVKK